MNALIKNKTAEPKEKQPKEKPSTDSLEARQANRHGFAVLYRKELCDCLTSWRMLILFFLLLFVMVVSLNAAIQNMADAISKSNGFNFLKLFTTGSDSIYSFATFMAFLGPLVGIGLGFDSVSNEKSQGTLISLASQPIYRDTIINAKFLAQATCVVMTVFAMGGIVCGVGLIRTGLVPEGEEVARILMYLLITAIYICMWLAFSTFLSVVNTHAATSAIIALAIWLCLTLFMNLIATNVANALYPTDGMNAYFNTMKNYNLQLGLNRVSPYYLYSEVISTILNPNVRSVGITTMDQYVGAIAGYLSFGQSMLLVWPQVVVMVAVMCGCFAAAYIAFMSREIRA